jgi:hypothetical protein
MAVAVFLFAMVAAPVIVALGAMWEGWVLAILWGWFVVPVFGLPALSVPVAIGLCLIASVLTNHKTGKEAEKEDVGLGMTVGVLLLKPGIALLAGWIVTKFI